MGWPTRPSRFALVAAHSLTESSYTPHPVVIPDGDDGMVNTAKDEKEKTVFKKIIASALVGGALFGGLAIAGPAGAAAPTAAAAAPGHAGKGHLVAWLRSHRRELRKDGLDLSAKTIGITPSELRTDLKAGNSIAGVATQHDVTPQTVVNALVSAADTKINQAASAHKLTSTQANKIEAWLPGRVTKIVNHTF